MVTTVRTCLLVTLLFFCGTVFSEEYPVYYSCDSMKVELSEAGEPGKIFLQGNVRISFEDVTITCEKASFNRVTGEIEAEGAISVATSEGIFTADYITYNVNEKTGVLSNTSFKTPPFYGKAGRVEKKEGVVLLYNGYITSCDLEKPHYRISAERMEYVPGDYIRAERMRLTFGEKLTVLYLPRLTVGTRTKEPVFSIMPGYSSRIGRTLDLLFAHKKSKGTDAVVKERISMGERGIGAGLKIYSEESGYSGEGFLYRRWGGDYFEPALLAEFRKNYTSRYGEGSLILDWRWMDNDDLFYYFFRDEYMRKSKTYNYLSLTQDFRAGIFNINFRQSAGEDFLNAERLPDVSFTTPFLRAGDSPVFIENDFRMTNFHKDDRDCIRTMDRITVESRTTAGPLAVTPYVSAAGVDYSGLSEDRFNLVGEAGVKISATMKKQYDGYTGYFSPSISAFSRGIDYKKGEIERFDNLESLDDGSFINLGLEWFFGGEKDYLGRISLENIYDIGRTIFDGNILKYDMRINPRIRIEGQNEFNLSEKSYRFGVNDLVMDFGRYTCSIGNRYDEEDDISGIEARFSHVVNEDWRYGIGIDYDINSGSFVKTNLDVWKRLHCWEMHIRISGDKDDFSFFVAAYPVLAF